MWFFLFIFVTKRYIMTEEVTIKDAIRLLDTLLFIKKNSLVPLHCQYQEFLKNPSKKLHKKLLEKGGYSPEQIKNITDNRNYDREVTT